MPPGTKKVAAAAKAPYDYLFAFVMSLGPVIGSFVVEPAETRWFVFAVGVAMVLAVLAAAAKPTDA